MITPEAYTVIERRVLLDHARVRMLVDTLEYGGRRRPYYYLESPVDAVATLALTDAGEAVLTRQYRHPLRAVMLDLPAGSLQPGEAPAEGARRELAEETGYRAGQLTALGRYNPFPGSLKVTAHLFLATALEPADQHLDEGEVLEVVRVPFADLLRGVLAGEYLDGSLQLAVALAAQKGLIP